ncbi:uncharacterized protein LOC131336157 isoform X2 [Rhododendron vialii]|uniref:uncharacterized protein LOC131336157 isoform X2 n=1 Tax=Rhododendron vialii TaxID=182163 RepID=UPI002660248E|nr:uncharacterized protein LOC131336157 isoform X2 [Rhododendron vialii]
MGFGALRSILRPVSRTLLSAHCTGSSFSLARTPAAASGSSFFGGGCPLHRGTRQMLVSSAFHSLTDNRFPKRRPSDKPRRKRASLRPPGPYAWVKCVPGEPILPNQPNEGSVKRRNEKKRMRQRRAFILVDFSTNIGDPYMYRFGHKCTVFLKTSTKMQFASSISIYW